MSIVDMQREFDEFFIISLCNVNASIYEGYFKAASIRFPESENIFFKHTRLPEQDLVEQKGLKLLRRAQIVKNCS